VGGISSSDEAEIRRHARDCPDCGALLELHEDLGALGQEIPEPSLAELHRMRSRILHEAASREDRLSWRSIGRGFGALLRIQPAGAIVILAMLSAGALLGRQWPAGAGEIDDARLLQAVQEQAASVAGVSGYWDAPFFYANVSARPAGTGQLALSFDVCRHVEAVTPLGSALARDVLLQAILEPTSVGTRLKAMSLAQGIVDGRLREVVIFALHRDPSLAVRLKALEVLMQSPYDPHVEEALLTTLRGDGAVQMRLQALECLTARQVDPTTLRQTIGAVGLESDEAVMLRAAELIHRL